MKMNILHGLILRSFKVLISVSRLIRSAAILDEIFGNWPPLFVNVSTRIM